MGTIFDAKTGNALGTNEHTMSFDSLNITMAEDKKPSIETIRETHIKWSDGNKSLSIETFMTTKELSKLLRTLIEAGA